MASNVLDSKAAAYAVGGLVLIGGIYFLGKRMFGAAGNAVSRVAGGVQDAAHTAGSSFLNSDPADPYNMLAGTPYAGLGIGGAATGAIDSASGHTLSGAGDWLSSMIDSWIHPPTGPTIMTLGSGGATPTTQYGPARTSLAQDRSMVYGDNFTTQLPTDLIPAPGWQLPADNFGVTGGW
jgi:hypothetical protein